MKVLEHPDITRVLMYGLPDYGNPPDVFCPFCGELVTDFMVKDKDYEYVGCNKCFDNEQDLTYFHYIDVNDVDVCDLERIS